VCLGPSGAVNGGTIEGPLRGRKATAERELWSAARDQRGGVHEGILSNTLPYAFCPWRPCKSLLGAQFLHPRSRSAGDPQRTDVPGRAGAGREVYIFSIRQE